MMCSVISFTLLGEPWNSWECSLKTNVSLSSINWELVEFLLIGFHVLDEVDKVAWLSEELKILSINHVTKLILNLNDQLNGVKRVESVVSKGAVQSETGFLGASEIVFDNGKDI